jgi:diadenosine tetraphosphate (Ap4A) HIT family hydrolase
MAECMWSLHPQLEKDTALVGDLALSRVLLASDANYPWLILVPRRAGMIELIDLPQREQIVLLNEIERAARALKEITMCEKLNIAALGNMVPQLHVHVIARQRDDAAWPKPIWGAAPPSAYDPAKREIIIGKLRRTLQIDSHMTTQQS